jgi:hypothetical protein
MFLLIAAVLFVAVRTSSTRGVPPHEALVAALAGSVPVGLLTAAATWAWARRRIALVAVTWMVGAAYLTWLFAVAVPANGAFYDSVDPGWNECQAMPEDAQCL